eukprot:4866629-Alexandrium_andersonii.AAC.1
MGRSRTTLPHMLSSAAVQGTSSGSREGPSASFACSSVRYTSQRHTISLTSRMPRRSRSGCPAAR